MRQDQASRIIGVIDKRIARKVGPVGAQEQTWGTVASLDADHQHASVFVYGSDVASDGFRLPNGLVVEAGDYVRLTIDPRGDRWVDEAKTADAYRHLEVDFLNGHILFGNGSAAPDTRLLYTASGLTLDRDGLPLDADLFVQAEVGNKAIFAAHVVGDLSSRAILEGDTTFTGIAFGPGNASRDVNLYRSGANVLKTDDNLQVGLTLTVLKQGNESIIAFPAVVNDSGWIKHIENNNVSEMQFRVSDDRGSSDFFSFGSAPAQVWMEAVRIRSDGAFEWSGSATERDVNLFRDSANVLRTSDQFKALSLYLTSGQHLTDASYHGFYTTATSQAQTIKAKALVLSSAFADPDPGVAGIQFGADVKLYRAGANVLQTDDHLRSGRTLGIYTTAAGTQTTVAAGATAALPWGTRVDPSAKYNSTTKQWTVPLTGLYRIAANVKNVNGTAGDWRRVYIKQNGSEIAGSSAQAAGGGTNIQHSLAWNGLLTAGDTIEIDGESIASGGDFVIAQVSIIRDIAAALSS